MCRAGTRSDGLADSVARRICRPAPARSRRLAKTCLENTRAATALNLIPADALRNGHSLDRISTGLVADLELAARLALPRFALPALTAKARAGEDQPVRLRGR
jgi:hypothetical protein